MENTALVGDLVSWIGRKPRPYIEVMDAWRTSCPRLSIWEDAVDAGLVERISDNKNGPMIQITKEGRAFLKELDIN